MSNFIRSVAAGIVCFSLKLLIAFSITYKVYATDQSEEVQYINRFIVKYHPESLSANKSSALVMGASSLGTDVEMQMIQTISGGGEVILSNQKLTRREADSFMSELAANPTIEYVEPDLLLQPDLVPNDPSYANLWGIHGPGGINAHRAWDIGSGKGSIVAVLDTGITSHSDLAKNVLAGYDFISSVTVANDGDGRDSNPEDPGNFSAPGECNAYPTNSSWHGTHVAGIISAVADNNRGGIGVAPKAGILPVRVLGKCGGYISDISDAIIWASGGAVPGAPVNEHPADVINMSLGGIGACGPTLQNAIDIATKNGAVIVASAGNDGADASQQRPANCNNVITVAATTEAGSLSGFSNYGNVVDISAPGSHIYSTYNTGSREPVAESYASMSGTSMAAPHVSGAIALLRAHDPTISSAQTKILLKDRAKPFSDQPNHPVGGGILDAYNLISGYAPIDNSLINGVARNPFSRSLQEYNNTEEFRIEVPKGSRDLSIMAYGRGVGARNFYVRYGSTPTVEEYDCLIEATGSNFNDYICTFENPLEGIYYIKPSIMGTYLPSALVASYQAEGDSDSGSQHHREYRPHTNISLFRVDPNETKEALINVSGRIGYAATSSTVFFHLGGGGSAALDLIAPDGTEYLLRNEMDAHYLRGFSSLDLSDELRDGVWALRISNHSEEPVYFYDFHLVH
ncbi:S8 family peptidase [Microbulbifer pacificus]|uniref:S8 family peptidase n=1 Tax=Microbulbifer pacificus TaxID=407164 RepID=UPI000CF50EFC|nr:S8 family peptidase [Microbulbifer pacificus]